MATYRMTGTDCTEARPAELTGLGSGAALKFAKPRRSVNRAVWLVGALLVLAGATTAAILRMPPFYGWYYHWAWYPVLIVLASSYALHTGRSSGSARLWLSLAFWSAPLWFTFELINLRIANWYYVFAADRLGVRVAAAFTAFATVLPAIYIVYRWIERTGLAERLQGPPIALYRHPRWVVGAGFAFLLSALWLPRLLFPLVWGFLTLVLEPWNYRRAPENSLLADLRIGRYRRIVRLLAAGALVGLIWEALNALAGTRWIYTVPGLEGHKLFEMPLPGFLGFPVFALDCYVAYQALVNAGLASAGWGESGVGPARSRRPHDRRLRRHLAAASITIGVTLAYGTAVTIAMDRWTIDSVYPEVEAIPSLAEHEMEALRSAGLERVEQIAQAGTAGLISVGLPPDRAEELAGQAELIAFRGIGTANASSLRDLGISDICELARVDPASIADAIRSDRPHSGSRRLARARVWVRSAERVCGAESG